MSQQPDNILAYAGSSQGIREIAARQRAILLCLLANILLYAVLLATQASLPVIVRALLALALLAIEVTAVVFVFMLATKIYPMALGIIFGILTLVPCLGLLILVIVNGKATTLLRQNGIKVGLLGAKLPPGEI